jgi:hypothetical protein
MSCGCGKKGVVRRTPSLGRPSVGPKSVRSAGPTPLELRTIGLQNAVSLTDSRTMDAQRRRIEKLRRDAIKRRFNK